MHPGGVLAFDGDGTLWDGDVGEDFFHAVVARGDFREPARRADGGRGARSRPRVRRHRQRDRGPPLPGLPGRPLPRGAGLRAHDLGMRRLDGGRGRSVRPRRPRPRRARGRGSTGRSGRVITWAETRKEPIDVFLVSASPWAVIDHASRLLRLPRRPRDRRPAAIRSGDDARERSPPHPVRAWKVFNLRARLGPTRPLYAAFGDNAFDIALLSEAFIPVAVRPKPRLRERAGEVKKLVEITREG